MRLRKSVSAASGNEIRNGRIAVASPVFCAIPVVASVMALSLLEELSKPIGPAARVAAATPQKRRRVIPGGSDMWFLLHQLVKRSGAIETPPMRAALPPRRLCGRAKRPEPRAQFGREE